jgi:hypothetical protein
LQALQLGQWWIIQWRLVIIGKAKATLACFSRNRAKVSKVTTWFWHFALKIQSLPPSLPIRWLKKRYHRCRKKLKKLNNLHLGKQSQEILSWACMERT